MKLSRLACGRAFGESDMASAHSKERPLRHLSPLLVLSLCSCSMTRMTRVEVTQNPIPDKLEQVALADAILLRDFQEVDETDAFRSGIYVGNLVFSGGFITEQQDVGLQNVSKQVDFEAEDRYREQVGELVETMFGDALDKRGKVRWQRVTIPADKVESLRMRAVRGTHDEDGRDNVVLPRFDLEAGSLPPEALSDIPTGTSAVIVPYVVLYYTHNAGWFLGQTYGHGAGARFRIFTVTYDAKTGAPLGDLDVTTRFIHEEVFQPNSGQLENFSIFTEQTMQRVIKKHLLK